MNISKIDSPNFQARMDVSKIGRYRYYWQEVADKFEIRTADKDVTVSLQEEIYGLLEFKVTTPQERCLGYIIYNKEDALTNQTPNNATKKLSQVFENFLKVTTECDNLALNDINKVFEENNGKHITIKTLSDLLKRTLTQREQLKNSVNSELSNNNDLDGFNIII